MLIKFIEKRFAIFLLILLILAISSCYTIILEAIVFFSELDTKNIYVFNQGQVLIYLGNVGNLIGIIDQDKTKISVNTSDLSLYSYPSYVLPGYLSPIVFNSKEFQCEDYKKVISVDINLFYNKSEYYLDNISTQYFITVDGPYYFDIPYEFFFTTTSSTPIVFNIKNRGEATVNFSMVIKPEDESLAALVIYVGDKVYSSEAIESIDVSLGAYSDISPLILIYPRTVFDELDIYVNSTDKNCPLLNYSYKIKVFPSDIAKKEFAQIKGKEGLLPITIALLYLIYFLLS